MSQTPNYEASNEVMQLLLNDRMDIPFERQAQGYRLQLKATCEMEEALSSKLPKGLKDELQKLTETINALATETAEMYYKHGFADGMDLSRDLYVRNVERTKQNVKDETASKSQNYLCRMGANMGFIEKMVLVNGTIVENLNVLWRSPIPTEKQCELILRSANEMSCVILGEATAEWSQYPELMVDHSMFLGNAKKGVNGL